MLRSMTGYGASHAQISGAEYDVEVRSVNNRYFKASIKLPDSWSSAESEIERILRQAATRGTVTLSLKMKLTEDRAAGVVNTNVLSRYLEQLKIIEVDANPTLRIDIGSMLLLPGVCETAPLDDILHESREELMDLVRHALGEMVRMREEEGKALGKDLVAQSSIILEKLALVAQRSPQVVLDYHERLANRVKDLTNAGKIDLDNDVLAREVALFAERCDIAEEISRLRSHVEQFLKTMDSPEPSGRKMDFIAQEMLREANTIGSKASDAAIAMLVVDIKTAIDRIKEQVQNVE